MKYLMIICLILTSCNRTYIIIEVNDSIFKSHEDSYCSDMSALWLPPNVGILDSEGDLTFTFMLNKNNLLIQDKLSLFDLDKIQFFFELDYIKEELGPFMGGSVEVYENDVEYHLTLYNSINPSVKKFIAITNKKLKIEQFKYIANNCKLYAVRNDGMKMDFNFTKETKFRITFHGQYKKKFIYTHY